MQNRNRIHYQQPKSIKIKKKKEILQIIRGLEANPVHQRAKMMQQAEGLKATTNNQRKANKLRLKGE